MCTVRKQKSPQGFIRHQDTGPCGLRRACQACNLLSQHRQSFQGVTQIQVCISDSILSQRLSSLTHDCQGSIDFQHLLAAAWPLPLCSSCSVKCCLHWLNSQDSRCGYLRHAHTNRRVSSPEAASCACRACLKHCVAFSHNSVVLGST